MEVCTVFSVTYKDVSVAGAQLSISVPVPKPSGSSSSEEVWVGKILKDTNKSMIFKGMGQN